MPRSLSKPGYRRDAARGEGGRREQHEENTATNEVKFVKNIQLDVEDDQVQQYRSSRHPLARIGKETTLADQRPGQDQITAYCRSHGYPGRSSIPSRTVSKDAMSSSRSFLAVTVT